MQAGVFDKVAGVLIGYNDTLQKQNLSQMEDILLELTQNKTFPIFKCEFFGHNIPVEILPVGQTATLKENILLYEI